ncbi:MAG TPA: DUF1614 domain-containing protein [Dehalococcoidales bacterium]|nr:DUF1614 domain-containing protein [Dehalococcoidales bacterium]
MFFFPIGCLLLVFFILFLPVLFLLIFFNVTTFSLGRLGVSPETALLILLFILIGSIINIPLTKKTAYYSRRRLFGWFEVPVRYESGLAINLGGAIIPLILSIYLLLRVPLWPVAAATVVMIVICKFMTRAVPGRGLTIPMFIPPILAALLAILLAREFAAPCAYISGVLGTLIGGDLLNLGKARKLGVGMVSIGGAGVFDGIFLVGIVSVLLTAFFG